MKIETNSVWRIGNLEVQRSGHSKGLLFWKKDEYTIERLTPAEGMPLGYTNREPILTVEARNLKEALRKAEKNLGIRN